MVLYLCRIEIRREIRRRTILFQLTWVSSPESLRSIALCREILNLHIARSTIFVCSVVWRIMVWDETLVTPSLATSAKVTRKSVFWKYFLVFSPVETSVKYRLTGAVSVCSVVRCRITEGDVGWQEYRQGAQVSPGKRGGLRGREWDPGGESLRPLAKTSRRGMLLLSCKTNIFKILNVTWTKLSSADSQG